MHERPLYYVFALFVAILVINLVSPAFGDGEIGIEGHIDLAISANRTIVDVSQQPASVNFTAVPSGGYIPDNYTWTVLEKYGRASPIYKKTPTTQNWFNCNFTRPGLYDLHVTAPNASDPFANNPATWDGYVVAYLPISANFTNTTTTGVLPLTVTFTDNSTDSSKGKTDGWQWQVGTGVPNQTSNPATGVYNEAKTYTINLTAFNRTFYQYNGIPENRVNGSISRDITINGKQPIIANFSTNKSTVTATQVKGLVPLALQFFDNSTGEGLDIHNWTFGDGTTNNVSDSPLKTYTTPGVYDVSLLVNSGNWSNTNTNYKLKPRYVNAYYPIAANFTYAPADISCTPPVFPITYNFKVNDTQTGNSIPDAWNWSFGDGTQNATTPNPSHTYNLPGTYDVILTTTNTFHSINASLKKQISVTGLYANFTAVPQIGYLNRTNTSVKVDFTANFTDVAGATSRSWDFGKNDGSGSISINANTTYDKPGTYNVKYTVGNQCKQTNSTTKTVKIIQQPVANFSYSPKYGIFPLRVQFNDTSLDNPDYWEWTFGDGSESVLGQNVSHVYNKPGKYNVRLRISNSSIIPIGSDDYTRPIFLSEGFDTSFEADPVRGAWPLTVQFTDTTEPAYVTNWSWDFGDNSPVNKTQNPSHTYYDAGNFIVNLTVKNTTTQAMGTAQSTIEVVEPIHANFEPNRTARMNETVGVTFKDLSTGNISDWFWQFGDGNISSEQEPTHFFPEFKEYNVNLTVYNTYYHDISSFNETVNITEMRAPISDFIGYPTIVEPEEDVYFEQKAQGPEISSYFWEFGDGETSTAPSPSAHRYALPGKYNVSLTVKNQWGTDTETKPRYIAVKGLIPDFTTVPAGWAVMNTPVTFIDNSYGSPVSWTWDFDDGTIESTQDETTSHTFTKNGTFYVNMTVTNWESKTESKTKPITIVDKTVPQGVDFEIPELKYSGTHPLYVQFEDSTPPQANVVEWFWEFGDGSNSFEKEPNHTYQKPGQYTVTLTVRNDAGTNEKRRVAYVVVI